MSGEQEEVEQAQGQEPEPAVEVRITARLLSDGRIEFALQQRSDGSWGARRRPPRRFFPASTAVGRWLRSSTLNINGQRLRVVARRLADGRIEFGMQHRRGEAWSTRILPTRRFFPTDARVNRWLSSTPLWAYPHQPRPSVCARANQIAEALAEAADKPCAQVTGADLAGIERLDLSNTGLNTLAATDLAGLDNLTNLDLSNNQLSAVPAGVFTYAPRITNLNLFNNRINRLNANTFKQLQQLRVLTLIDNPGTPFNNLNTPTNTTILQ